MQRLRLDGTEKLIKQLRSQNSAMLFRKTVTILQHLSRIAEIITDKSTGRYPPEKLNHLAAGAMVKVPQMQARSAIDA